VDGWRIVKSLGYNSSGMNEFYKRFLAWFSCWASVKGMTRVSRGLRAGPVPSWMKKLVEGGAKSNPTRQVADMFPGGVVVDKLEFSPHTSPLFTSLVIRFLV